MYVVGIRTEPDQTAPGRTGAERNIPYRRNDSVGEQLRTVIHCCCLFLLNVEGVLDGLYFIIAACAVNIRAMYDINTIC